MLGEPLSQDELPIKFFPMIFFHMLFQKNVYQNKSEYTLIYKLQMNIHALYTLGVCRVVIVLLAKCISHLRYMPFNLTRTSLMVSNYGIVL